VGLIEKLVFAFNLTNSLARLQFPDVDFFYKCLQGNDDKYFPAFSSPATNRSELSLEFNADSNLLEFAFNTTFMVGSKERYF